MHILVVLTYGHFLCPPTRDSLFWFYYNIKYYRTYSINLMSRLHAILLSITKKTARKWKYGIVDDTSCSVHKCQLFFSFTITGVLSINSSKFKFRFIFYTSTFTYINMESLQTDREQIQWASSTSSFRVVHLMSISVKIYNCLDKQLSTLPIDSYIMTPMLSEQG